MAGRACSIRAYLRKDSVGGICSECRKLLVWDGLVPAARARQHLQKLSRAGVGRRAVAAASDVSSNILSAIRSGSRRQIRASTEKRILAVDGRARADRSIVPASGAWRRIRQLQDEGFSKAELARRLGLRTEAIQIGKAKITARTAVRIERLYQRCVA